MGSVAYIMGNKVKHLFVLNPAAGKHDSSGELHQLIDELGSARGLDFRTIVTQGPGDATARVGEAVRSGDELRIYACGGDGTLNEVVNGAAGWANAAVTHVPCGSGNDFVKLFSEPAAFADLGRLMDPEEALFDVVRVNDRLSVGVCSIGFDARIGTDIARYKRLPLVTGPGAYALSIAANLIRGVHEHYRIELEGRVLDGRYTMVSLCNGRWYGGGYCPVPEADPSDGLLDVLLVRAVSRATVVRVIGKYKQGRYRELSNLMTHHRCRSIRIRADAPTAVNLDGELLRTDDVHFAIEPGKLRFFYPRGLQWRPKTPAPVERETAVVK